MTIKINKVLFYVLVLGSLVGLFFLGRCSRQKEITALNAQTTESKDSLVHFKVKIDSLTYEVAQKNEIIYTKEQAISEGKIEKEKYKKLYYAKIEHDIELEARISMLIDSIHNNANIIFIDTGHDSTPCAKLPFTFDKKDQYVNLSGSFDTNAKMSLKLAVDVPLDIVIGLKKKGTPTVSVLSQNPYVNILKINGLKITEEKKWYNSPYLYLDAGFVGGVVISHYVK
jgi:hypothetical protein